MKKNFFNIPFFYLVIITVSLAISLEFLLRIEYPENYKTYSYFFKHKRYLVNNVESVGCDVYCPSNYYAYQLKPNLDLTVIDRYYSISRRIRTNSDGFTFFKQDNYKPNIMVLGDSVTFSLGTEDFQSYPVRLQEILRNEFDVLNFGVGGWGFAEYYLTYQKYVNRYKPQLIIIGIFPANDFSDLFYSSWQGKEEGKLPCSPLTRRDIYIDEYGQLRDNSLTYEFPVLRESSLYIFVVRQFFYRLMNLKNLIQDKLSKISTKDMSLRIIQNIAQEHDVLVLLLPSAQDYGHRKSLLKVEQYQDELKRLKKIHLIDLYPIIRPNYKNLYADGVHFNREGNTIVAREIDSFIKRYNLLEGKNFNKVVGDSFNHE